MRELEFLPEWYPKIRCRKRMVMLQTWITMILVAGLGLWMFMAQRNVRSAEGSLSVLSRELVETEQELRKLDDLIGLQRQMQAQDRVQTKLGMHVPVTKLMNALETAMPTEMAVVEFALDTEELARPAPASGFGNARDRKAAPVDDDRPPARRLKVRLVGVVPTDVDLANFLANLSNIAFLENVAMTYARDRGESGHVMREFEVTFGINLTPGGN